MPVDYTIRNYRATDFDAFVALRNLSAELSPDTGYLSPEAVRGMLGRPGYDPARDLFVAEAAGSVIGYVNVSAEPQIGRAVLDCCVSVDNRGEGVATELCREATPRAQASGAGVVHVNVREQNSLARSILEAAGFRVVRRFHELETDLSLHEERPAETYPIRPLAPGEARLLTDIQNRAFTGSWGFCPNTVEEITYAIGGGDSVEGIQVAMDGDRPAAYCRTVVQCDASGRSWGRVSMIGVDPDYQGRGLGKQLLLAGLGYLRGKGIDLARLTVDGENESALSLYRSAGFTERDRSLWYEKALA